MRVGISFLPPGEAISAFSSGRAQASVTLGEVLRQLGHSITLVSLGKERWFIDCKEEAAEWNVCLLEECVEPFDIFIDMYGNIQSTLRRQLGQRVILMMREDMSMALRENVIYENDRRVFSFDGVDCVWTAREEDAELLRVLSKKQVEVIPFYWSPWHLSGAEEWPSSEYNSRWELYIVDNNTRINSSCVPSLMIAEELLTKEWCIDKVVVLNAERLVESKYFKANLKSSLNKSVYDGRFEFCGRLKTTDIALNEKACVLHYERFESSVPKSVLLDLVWLGVPVIHNSRWLRDFGHDYDDLYYEDASGFSLQGAGSLQEATHCSARETFGHNLEGWATDGDRRISLTKRFSCINAAAWQKALNPQPVVKPAVAAPPARFVIQFSDFWADFNPDYNFFTLLFTEALRATGDKRRVVGVGEKFLGRADLVICGPYSERWRTLDKTIPKICFTGELSAPVYGDGIFLNIGFFQHGYKYHDTGINYCRFPLWAASINWFGADNNRLVNPTLMDLDDCLASHEGTSRREKFCAFVVSNPSNKVRNDAFQKLHAFKPVDSAGALFNNMGSGLFAGLGGGGGERRKVEFFKNYRFALTYENSSCSGYTTEKLFHAKVAGCVPLYWGDPIAAQDFHPRGYINLTNKEGELVEIVRELEESPEEIDRIASMPALSVEKMDQLRGVMAMIVKYTLDHVFPLEKPLWQTLPRALGARSTAEAALLAETRDEKPLDITPVTTPEFGRQVEEIRVVVTASEADIGDLYLWLSYMKTIRSRLKSDIILRWTGRAESRQLVYIKKMYDWIRIIIGEVANSNGFTCYLSPRVVLVGNPYYMCCVADTQGSCVLKTRNRLTEDGHHVPFDDVVICKGSAAALPSQRIFADNFVGVDSLEGSRAAGKVFYYFGADKFKYKEDFLPGISECSMINLKRRPDRLDRFAKNHVKETIDKIKIVDAVDGKALVLTPHIQRLFEDNNFGWKKGAIGCNLSHLSIWYGLSHSHQFIENMLVLEDDVRFSEGWEERLVEAMREVPVDFDVLYLGGLLPSNRDKLNGCLEPINTHWARIKKNTWFGHEEPTAYFHFCTYSYILSKRGAEKLLAGIERDNGYKNVVDHQILNPINELNIYVITPLLAGCFQEDDPAYTNTDFNETNKEKTFDSDLWTCKDTFIIDKPSSEKINIEKVIEDLKVANKEPVVPLPMAAVSPNIYFLHKNATNTYEKEWLAEIMDMPSDCWEKAVILNEDNLHEIVAQEKSHLIVVYREGSEEDKENKEVRRFVNLIVEAKAKGKKLIVIHLSDEFKVDDISFYPDPCISLVIRNYIRGDIPADIRNKVLTIPLGYYRRPNAAIPALDQRQLLWSFHGTTWFNRQAMIDTLSAAKPHTLRVRASWEDEGSTAEEYIADMMNSVIIPCPKGNNLESYRIYEALEAGAIPFLVDENSSKTSIFYSWIQTALPSIVISKSWEGALRLLDAWRTTPEEVIERHRSVMAEWARWKNHLRTVIKKFVFWA